MNTMGGESSKNQQQEGVCIPSFPSNSSPVSCCFSSSPAAVTVSLPSRFNIALNIDQEYLVLFAYGINPDDIYRLGVFLGMIRE